MSHRRLFVHAFPCAIATNPQLSVGVQVDHSIVPHESKPKSLTLESGRRQDTG